MHALPSSWRQVALLPLRSACRRTQWLGSAGLLFGCLGTPWVLRAFGLNLLADKLAPVLLGVLIVVAWCGYIGALLRQNEPNAARLVPGHVRRLQQVMVGAWLATTLFVGALTCGLFGLGLTAWMAPSVGLIAVAWMVRQPVLWLAVWVLPAFSWWWMKLAPVRWARHQLEWLADTQPLIAVLLVLLLAMLLLPAAIQTGGARHRRRRERVRRAAEQRRQGPGHWYDTIGWSTWVQRQTSRPYRAWMRFLCARPQRSPMARAMLGLGPSPHWTSHAAVASLIVTSVLGIIATVLVLVPSFDRQPLVGPALGMMCFSFNPLLQARTALHQTRREQALLALLPGVPRGAALNLALARRLSAHYLVAWGLGGLLALGITHGVPSATLVVQCAVAGSLPFVLLLWRDWSRTSEQSASGVAWTVLAMVMVMFALVTMRRADVVCAEVMALTSLLLTLVGGARRYQALARAPAAWPAGRTGA